MIKKSQSLLLATITVGLATAASAGPTYTSVDFPGAVATTLNGGPNPEGTNIGTYTDTSGVIHGFTLQNGIYTTIDPPGSSLTVPNWISPQGEIVGEYLDAAGVAHGFTLADGIYATVDYPGAGGSALDGLNPPGEMVGFFCTTAALCTAGFEHSYVRTKDGGFVAFDPPGASSSLAASVTSSGVIVGSYAINGGSVNGNTLGYKLDQGVLTTIQYPNSVSTFAGAINFEGTIVGDWVDAAGNGHGFILNGSTFSSFDFPGGAFTDAAGINPNGVIVGIYFTADGAEHGFIRTP